MVSYLCPGQRRRHRPGRGAGGEEGANVQAKSVSQEREMLPTAGKSLRMPFVVFK